MFCSSHQGKARLGKLEIRTGGRSQKTVLISRLNKNGWPSTYFIGPSKLQYATYSYGSFFMVHGPCHASSLIGKPKYGIKNPWSLVSRMKTHPRPRIQCGCFKVFLLSFASPLKWDECLSNVLVPHLFVCAVSPFEAVRSVDLSDRDHICQQKLTQ